MDERQMECKKQQQERIFENTCIAVNTKSKKILSIVKVTDDEHVRDSKVLPELGDSFLKSNITVIGKLFADGAYDNNDIFRCLTDKGILPCIKVRMNPRLKWKKGNFFRNLSILAQKKRFARMERHHKI